MLLIAIDTSGRNGSVALCRGEADNFETLQLATLEGGTYSAKLMPTIADLLQQNNLHRRSLDGFAVVSGPGSFTGLRVGLATVKGLCEILQKPLATISMLEALALEYGSAGQRLTTLLDAGRGEIYVGEYEVSPGSAKCLREFLVKLEEFASNLDGASILLTPDAKIADGLSSTSIRLVEPIHADQIGRIGLIKILAGNLVDPATVDVNYIRRSDAEIFSPPKR